MYAAFYFSMDIVFFLNQQRSCFYVHSFNSRQSNSYILYDYK
jgi:hypothetical protein